MRDIIHRLKDRSDCSGYKSSDATNWEMLGIEYLEGSMGGADPVTMSRRRMKVWSVSTTRQKVPRMLERSIR